jgi:hypothetical protein
MRTLTKSLIFPVAIMAISVTGAHAKDKKTDLQQETVVFDAGKGNTVTSETLLKELTKFGERDNLRATEDLNVLKTNTHMSGINRIKSEKQKSVEKFILENVPVQYIAAGEAEVLAYIRTHFIDNKQRAQGSGVVEAWASDDSALVAPSEYQAPVAVISRVGGQRDDSVIEIGPETPPAQEPIVRDDTKPDKQEFPSDGGVLGFTQDELTQLINGTPREVTPPKEQENSNANTTVGVVIKDMTVDRAIVSKRLQKADITVNFTIVDNNDARQLKKTFNNVVPGYMFEVNGNRFEVVSIDSNRLVLENLNTGTTHTEIMN